MSRAPIPTYAFSVVVVRRGDQTLLVHERGGRWFLPAGRVEPGETLEAAAVRETLEESGVPIRLTGIFAIQHTVVPEGQARLRAIFAGAPVDDTPPKSEPDDDTLGAGWFDLEAAASLPLRSPEVLEWIERAEQGIVYPLSLLEREG